MDKPLRLRKAQLDRLVEEATVDAYGEEEPLFHEEFQWTGCMQSAKSTASGFGVAPIPYRSMLIVTKSGRLAWSSMGISL
jgi:hypothetical protein